MKEQFKDDFLLINSSRDLSHSKFANSQEALLICHGLPNTKSQRITLHSEILRPFLLCQSQRPLDFWNYRACNFSERIIAFGIVLKREKKLHSLLYLHPPGNPRKRNV